MKTNFKGSADATEQPGNGRGEDKDKNAWKSAAIANLIERAFKVSISSLPSSTLDANKTRPMYRREWSDKFFKKEGEREEEGTRRLGKWSLARDTRLTREKLHSETIDRHSFFATVLSWLPLRWGEGERRRQLARRPAACDSLARSRARKLCPERFVSLVTWRHADRTTWQPRCRHCIISPTDRSLLRIDYATDFQETSPFFISSVRTWISGENLRNKNRKIAHLEKES